MSEPSAGSDAFSMRTTAKRNGSGYRLDGSAAPHTALTTTDQALSSGLAAGTNDTDVDLRATLDYAADPAGTYTLAYTVTVNPAP